MILETAPAKINLVLHVRRKRPDGYHDLETLFAFARDGDVIALTPSAEWHFAIDGPFSPDLLCSPAMAGAEAHSPGHGAPAFAGEQENLVTRAVNRFTSEFPQTPPHAITLTKNLPIASGIGGGSADAAATLRAFARLAGIAATDPRLDAISRSLGADVPACLAGRTALGLGRGDELQSVDGLAGIPLLLVNPGVPVSTAAVFAGWDGQDRGGIGGGDLLARARAGRNDLEPPARRIAPAIDAVLSLLAAADGVLLARMSGSGATCFALFGDEAARDVTARDAETRGWWTMVTSLA